MAEYHILHNIDEELEKLKTRLIRMGSIVQEQVELALKALDTGNTEIAALVIERDEKVDKLDIKIDRQCMQLFALQQPVANDLRLIMSSLSINNNLERIGDLAVNVAERVEPLHTHLDIVSRSGIVAMGGLGYEMVSGAIDAFINADIDLARSLVKRDTEIDMLDRKMFQDLTTMMSTDPALVLPGSHLMLISRNIERLADQATNICEEVLFLVEAEIVRHRQID